MFYCLNSTVYCDLLLLLFLHTVAVNVTVEFQLSKLHILATEAQKQLLLLLLLVVVLLLLLSVMMMMMMLKILSLLGRRNSSSSNNNNNSAGSFPISALHLYAPAKKTSSLSRMNSTFKRLVPAD